MNTKFSEVISTLRKANRTSQNELAKIFHVSQQTVAAWETGRCTPGSELLMQLADYFEVSVDDLLGRNDDHRATIKTNIGNNIRKLRERRGLSQAALSKKLSISQSTLAMYEKDKRKPSLDMLISFATFFGVSTDYLLSINQTKQSSNVYDNVKQIAHQKGISLQQIATKANLSTNSIYGWQKNTPRPSTVAAVAAVLDVSVSDIVKPDEADIDATIKAATSYKGVSLTPNDKMIMQELLKAYVLNKETD